MFQIGQVFEESYPPEAAVWCNESGKAYIEELESGGDMRRFQIKAVPAPTKEELAQSVRSQRDALIAETDYLILPDYPLSEEDRAIVIRYRQALRDVPEQAGFPTEVNWPEKPEWVK